MIKFYKRTENWENIRKNMYEYEDPDAKRMKARSRFGKIIPDPQLTLHPDTGN
jgi:hypothetical protein